MAAADKAYGTQGFVARLRQINAIPHVARTIERKEGSAIDGRTTRHAGCALSLFARMSQLPLSKPYSNRVRRDRIPVAGLQWIALPRISVQTSAKQIQLVTEIGIVVDGGF